MPKRIAIQINSENVFYRPHLFLTLMILIAATPMLAAQCQPILGPVLALELGTPAGSTYVNFLGESDGPVSLPIESNYAEAIQVSTRVEESTLRVMIHSVVDDFTIEPIGKYDLVLPRELDLHEKSRSNDQLARERWEAVDLYELEALGLHDWSMRLTVLRPSLTKLEEDCECCSCGSLYCCPNPGKCIGCGSCGDCCCTSGPG